ncbi:hypothetical protein U1Q18_004739 [Sarracenia purpurea var. burkii]
MITLSLPSPANLVPSPSFKTAVPSRRENSSSQTLKHPDFEPLKNRLIRLANVGHLHQAISAVDLMTQQGFTPDVVTYSVLLKSCIRTGQFELGKLVHTKLCESGLNLDSVVLNSLISLYSKSGDWVMANSIFEGLGERRDLVSWSAMISCFAHNALERRAISTFFDMLEYGKYPNQFCFSAVIRACSNPGNAWIGMIIFGIISVCAELGLLSLGQQLHSQVVKQRLAFDVCVGCSLVDMYAKCAADGSMVDSRKVFDLMPGHNVMSWTAIITGYVQSGGHDKEAVELYCRMIQDQVLPNHFTFSSLLKACGNISDPAEGEQIYAHAVKLGLGSVNCVGNSLISMHARAGRMEDARKAFDVLFEKNLVSYNTIVDGYAKNLGSDEAFEIFNQIEDAGIGIDAFTFASLLSGAASIGAIDKGEQIHARLLKSGCKSNQCTSNALVSMYSRCGNIEAALQVFTEMENRNHRNPLRRRNCGRRESSEDCLALVGFFLVRRKLLNLYRNRRFTQKTFFFPVITGCRCFLRSTSRLPPRRSSPSDDPKKLCRTTVPHCCACNSNGGIPLAGKTPLVACNFKSPLRRFSAFRRH